MEVKAVSKYIKVQPRKVRIIADQVRGKYAMHASALLRYHPSKGARELRKALLSAVANAEANHGISADLLKISTIMIDAGPKQKRITQKAMGRGARIEKKTSHITVVVEDTEPQARIKPHGTKAKPRPTLAAPTAKGGKKKAAEAKAEEAAPVAEVEVTEEAVAEPVVEEAAAEAEAPAVEAEASEEKGAE
jgi:large subunit ribosomal protein L22